MNTIGIPEWGCPPITDLERRYLITKSCSRGPKNKSSESQLNKGVTEPRELTIGNPEPLGRQQSTKG